MENDTFQVVTIAIKMGELIQYFLHEWTDYKIRAKKKRKERKKESRLRSCCEYTELIKRDYRATFWIAACLNIESIMRGK